MTSNGESYSGQETVPGVPLLSKVDRPADLKQFSIDELRDLAAEIRARIIETAAQNGGHLAAHLGVVELTLAIHHVFDTEQDKLVWDVGHQSYAHKLLTGRKDRFDSVRLKDGLSAYPKRSESPYDAFGTGHSSTSISAALGMAVARDRSGGQERAIAVIGDGAMTGGMAFEALAHAGHLGTDLLVILNDNSMSISPNVGALSAYFSRLITGGLYSRAREDLQVFMERMLGTGLAKAAQRFEHSVKGFLTPGVLFEELGFKYVGPVDGHDLDTLVECLSNLKRLRLPVFFHCVTKKGRGYSPAENDPQRYHGVKAFNIETGEFESRTPGGAQTFTEVFGDAVIAAAKADPAVVAITAAMPTGTGLSKVEKVLPDRVFDVGICEQHAVTFAAGLAASGLRPICAIYSTFLQRGYDQYIHDVCLQGLPVVFAIDRAGAVGEDSPTHQGAYDLSFLRIVPGVTVLAPRDGVDLTAMVHWSLGQTGPVAIRYPRGSAATIGDPEGRDITRGEMLRDGDQGTFLAVGPIVKACLEAADLLEKDEISVGVADARLVKPLDAELLDAIKANPIVTVEENARQGGFGTAVLEHFEQLGCLHDVRVRTVGFPDTFANHATREEQLEDMGLDAASLAATMRLALSPTP